MGDRSEGGGPRDGDAAGSAGGLSRRRCLAASGSGATFLVSGCGSDGGGGGDDETEDIATGGTETAPPADATPTASPTETPVERATPEVRSSPLGSGEPATMADYWNGDAVWSFVRKNPDISYDGSHVEVMDDGTWYLFNRTPASQSTCEDVPGMGTQVRKSTNRGETWSDPVRIISPEPDTPYACAATDGDVWYDADEEVWHYLFQGLDPDGWSGCLLSREGTDPMGEFAVEPPGGNPVVEAGELWDQICDAPDDDCAEIAGGPGNVHDEGTFDVFDYDGTHYWVAFHGYDGRHGFRGIAKTLDFQEWIAGDPDRGVPPDAVHDEYDTVEWREDWAAGGPIGVGQGTMLYEDGYYYHLVEGSDIDLACSRYQNWDYGLFRSESLASTDWAQFPRGNPTVYSSKGETGEFTMCNVQYAGLFRDPTDGAIYRKYGRRSAESAYDAIYWYRLEGSSNRLTNATLWRADSHGWHTRGDATATVYRYPNQSPDGTPFMSVDGTGTRGGTQSVYQDVSAPSAARDAVEFGGMFTSEDESGALTVALHQIDGNGDVARTDRHPIRTGTEWAAFGSSAPLASASETLRYEFQVDDAGVYRATDMYVRT